MVVEVVWWCGGDVVKKMNSKKGDAVRSRKIESESAQPISIW